MYTNQLGRTAPKSFLFYSQGGNRKWNEPNWNVIPTKGMKISSEQELVQQIKDFAKKEALDKKQDFEKSNEEINDRNKQYNHLMAQYISTVSPDRKSLHKQAMNIIPRISAGATAANEPIHKSLAEFLNEREGIENPVHIRGGFPYPLPLPSGKIQPIAETLGGYGYEVYATGEPKSILTGSFGNWTFTPTSAESKRVEEFVKIFKTEKDLVRRRMEIDPEYEMNNSAPSVDYRA